MQPAPSPASTTPATDVRYVLLRQGQETIPFQGMTYKSFQPLLASLVPHGPGVAVGALLGEGSAQQPVGLVLAQRAPEPDPTQVVSLFVSPAFRHQGIGTALMAHLEEALSQQGVRLIFGVYPSGKDTTPFLERLLAQRGWLPPRPRMYLFQAGRASAQSVLPVSWLKPRELPPEYRFFPWRELKAADRAVIREGVESGRIPSMLSPFNEEATLDPDISTGLRYGPDVYGWMICHRIAPDTIRYTALYVREDIPVKGLGFKCFAESARRHLDRDRELPGFVACWGVLASNPFAAFLQRRLLPHLADVSYSLTQETQKELVAAPPEQG